MNWLTDMNSGWWPFLYLRPPKTKEIDNSLLLKISIRYGLFYGLILGVCLTILFNKFSLIILAAAIIYMFVMFILFYRFTFAFFWNRRARRLVSEV